MGGVQCLVSAWMGQCGINLPGLDKDNGTFHNSGTPVVEKFNFSVAASKHRGTSMAE